MDRTPEFVARLTGILNSNIDPDLARDAWEYGMTWYRDAHDYAWKISNTYGISLEQACGLLAATSIRTRWDNNLRDAMLAAAGMLTVGLKIRRDKCAAILDLPEKHTVDDVLNILRGPKISAFMQNILDPDSTVATIDVWMCRAFDVPHSAAKGKTYDQMQDAVRIVADMTGVPVPTMQAIIWVIVRGKAD